MHVEFHGAARTVTGSATLVEAAGTRVLVDCGLFQGDAVLERRNAEPFGFNPASLDAVVLTHAHVDHIGRAATLVRQGYRGRFWCTRATSMLAPLMLLDVAKVAAEDAREGGPPPPFGEEEVERLHQHTAPIAYGEERRLSPSVSLRLSDAGHILGSAHVLLTLTEGKRTVRFGISGDVGAPGHALVSDPTPFDAADYVQVETTYGDRDHRPYADSVKEFAAILEEAERGPGNVLVPAFALGRTQEVLYHVASLKAAGRLRRLPVYVDSPLATRLTDAYRLNPASFDDDARRMLRGGHDPFSFPGLRFVASHQESQELSRTARGALIVAGSGMAQGGRIQGHLRVMLSLPETHVVIVGYQAPGTLGRALVDRRPVVRIRGQEVPVRARIHTIGGFSAHADRSDLLDWVRAVKPPPRLVFLVHGELDALMSFSKALEDGGQRIHVPRQGERFELQDAPPAAVR